MKELNPKPEAKELLANYLYYIIYDGVNEAINVDNAPDNPVSNVSSARLLAKRNRTHS